MSADPLREKLKALVGELHQQAALYRRGQEISDSVQALAYTQCARKLAALLAKSEPEPCHHCGRAECDGGCRELPPVLQISRADIARVYGHHCDSPGCPACGGPDCEAKAKLPLQHRR